MNCRWRHISRIYPLPYHSHFSRTCFARQGSLRASPKVGEFKCGSQCDECERKTHVFFKRSTNSIITPETFFYIQNLFFLLGKSVKHKLLLTMTAYTYLHCFKLSYSSRVKLLDQMREVSII